jgi:Spy/CpxP family protein refolding chaperone
MWPFFKDFSERQKSLMSKFLSGKTNSICTKDRTSTPLLPSNSDICRFRPAKHIQPIAVTYILPTTEHLNDRSQYRETRQTLSSNPENSVKLSPLLLAMAISMPLTTTAQHNHGAQTPYAGMHNRAIKSLSDNDIKELRRGGGWGLALAAELNGMPGPAHLLELKDQLQLTQDQVAKTQGLVDDMRQAAIPTGERLIAAESALESAFAKGSVDEASLRRLLADTESARTELRYIHLSQHFKTVQFLKPEQIKRYNILRGYAEDPCKNIPAGHNPEMYRRHMGCN